MVFSPKSTVQSLSRWQKGRLQSKPSSVVVFTKPIGQRVVLGRKCDRAIKPSKFEGEFVEVAISEEEEVLLLF